MYQLIWGIHLKVRSVTPCTQSKDLVKVKLVQEDLNEDEIIKSSLGSYQNFKNVAHLKTDFIPGELLYN